jgi:hypothetical protein
MTALLLAECLYCLGACATNAQIRVILCTNRYHFVSNDYQWDNSAFMKSHTSEVKREYSGRKCGAQNGGR